MNSELQFKIGESQRVIKTAITKWYPHIGIAFTGRKDSTVLMHLILGTMDKKIPAMFIDHGLHFKETYENLDKLQKQWDLNVLRVADENLLKKLKSSKRIKNKKIILRKLKIKTIKITIGQQKWKALFTAIRWDENPARSGEKYYSKRNNHYRVHPMLHWNETDIWEYIRTNKIPYISLYDKGYRSIGDKLSTVKSSSKKNERSGREKEKEEIMQKLRSLGYF